ncbi:MAG TPA: hypothetical protein VHB74_11085 [Devosia sp.]|nr:hypothetical protein [Devosia sp.]
MLSVVPHQLRSETKIRFRRFPLFRAHRPGSTSPRRRLPPLEIAFLAVAVAIVGLAMVSAGRLVSVQMAASITSGIADTTAASMDVMLSDELAEIGPARPLPAEAVAGLNALFSAANDTRVNKLVQIRLRRPDGSLLYESLSGLIDSEPSPAVMAAARQGRPFSSLLELPLVAVGPGTAGTLPVLKLIIPIHDRASGAVEATAELYFGASSLIALQKQSEWRIWTIIGAIGAIAILALFGLIHRTSRIIDTQQHRLADSLAASQTLAAENVQLRRQAVVANERLLAQVGADLHDGPLQLLAAHILALSRRGRSAAPAELAAARQAIEELRNISAGLVLPELSGLALEEAIGLAVRRHEEMTGATVDVRFGELPAEAPLDLKVCLYRIAQEGLGNAARHGVSGSAAIAIGFAQGRVTLEITNKVEASRPAEAPPAQPARTRLGLAGMRARLEAIGGQLVFERGDATARLVAYAPL